MDNLPARNASPAIAGGPKDPSNPNNNNPTPPPFGNDFNPHVNPPDPNNPYQSQPPQPSTPPSLNPLNTPNIPDPNLTVPPHHQTHSDVAQHRQRDTHGHFLPYEHAQAPTPQIPQTTPITPTSQTTPNPSFLPPLIETNPKAEKPDSDPPIVTVRNPIVYIKRWWNRILAKEGVDFKLGFKIRPVTAILIASILISGGLGSGITAIVLKTFWPTSSPVLHRQIIEQGIIQKSSTGGFYLTTSNSVIWKLKPKITNINFNEQIGKQVTITGNMTTEKNLIEVSEVILQTP